MTNQLMQLELNKGLDLVTPPLSIEAGSLIGCLNYELTNIAGLHRIDGYERYDGYPNGTLYNFYQMTIDAGSLELQQGIIPGTIISRGGTGIPFIDIGIVLGKVEPDNAASLLYYVSPFINIELFTVEEAVLLASDGVTPIELQSQDGLLQLAEVGGTLGTDFVADPPDSSPFEVSMLNDAVIGSDTLDAPAYIQALRDYSAILRSYVLDAPYSIAGLHWHRDRLIAAVDMPYITVTVGNGNPTPSVGIRVRLNGVLYRIVNITTPIVGDTITTMDVYLLPIGTANISTDDLVEVNVAGTAVTTWATSVVANGLFLKDKAKYAALGYYNNPDISSSRGFTYYPPAVEFKFIEGKASTEDGPVSSMIAGKDYYLVGSGIVAKIKLASANPADTSGTWGSGTAYGQAQIIITELISGTRDYPLSGDEIHSEYPTTAGSKVMELGTTSPNYTAIAGTGALNLEGTKYQWNTFNFYGQSSTLTSYGTTGASRGFWVNSSGYGNIYGVFDDAIDKPKYNAYHNGRLVLAYPRGSVLLSAVGNPTDFSGLRGAIEVSTGDDITGLLELAGSALGIFGRRSIRKLTGNSDADMDLSTISSNEGCIDYSACMVGMTPVYCTVNGITSLEQTAAYGDFVGQRISDSISTWLRPKLVNAANSGERGGIVGAYTIRTKGQYRLVLQNGDTVVVTFTQAGPKITFSNYSTEGRPRIPYCLSSAVSDSGVEHVHCRWDNPVLATRAIQLEAGWGFDGKVFPHYFETAHVFSPNSQMQIGVEKVRMYGQGYGQATLDLKAAGIERDFNQKYHSQVQDISMPIVPDLLYPTMQPVTSIVDSANTGLGIKLKVQGSVPEDSTLTEPAHICQVLVLHVRAQGAIDG